MSARMATAPEFVTVTYRGVQYTLDLGRCRRALVGLQVAGMVDSMKALAKMLGISRSTASRFFAGGQTSLGVTLKILEGLGLPFDDVAKPVPSGYSSGRLPERPMAR